VAQSDRDKWNQIYADRESAWREGRKLELGAPSSFWAEIEDRLPRSGRALDLAGGTGRHALAMARRGLSATVADISDAGLRVAEAAAGGAGLQLETLRVDLDAGLPAGPWRFVFVHHFLDRQLIRGVAEVLEPGGFFAMCHPTRRNLERHERPSARYLLQEDELAGLLDEAGLEVLSLSEEWTAEGRHEARALAKRRE